MGNWARVSQAVTVPPDFHNYHKNQPEFTFGALGYTLTYRLFLTTSIRGPDDCGGYYTDPYPAPRTGGGINFVISGADCDRNMWGGHRINRGGPTLRCLASLYTPKLALISMTHGAAIALTLPTGTRFLGPQSHLPTDLARTFRATAPRSP
jgi:hypothetical protein